MPTVLTPDVLRMAVLLVLSATWLLIHADLTLRALRARLLSPFQRLLCLLPPFTILFAYRLGARRRAVLSVALFVLYVAIRTFR